MSKQKNEVVAEPKKTRFRKGELKKLIEEAREAGKQTAEEITEWLDKVKGRKTATTNVYQTLQRMKREAAAATKDTRRGEPSLTDLLELNSLLEGRREQVREAIEQLEDASRLCGLSLGDFLLQFDKLEEMREAFIKG